MSELGDLLWISPEPDESGIYEVRQEPTKGWDLFARVDALIEHLEKNQRKKAGTKSRTARTSRRRRYET